MKKSLFSGPVQLDPFDEEELVQWACPVGPIR